MTKTKFIPRQKESQERVRVKPPTAKPNLYKLDFNARLQIHKLSLDLPIVPYFMIGPDGLAKIQQTTKTEFKGQSDTINGRVNNFIKGKETRQMNHKVTLNQQYQLRGQVGIDDYVKYVVDLHNNLMSMSQALNSITAEPKVPNKPTPEEFGWIGTEESSGELGKWTIEGGEAEYNKALAYFEEKENYNVRVSNLETL